MCSSLRLRRSSEPTLLWLCFGIFRFKTFRSKWRRCISSLSPLNFLGSVFLSFDILLFGLTCLGGKNVWVGSWMSTLLASLSRALLALAEKRLFFRLLASRLLGLTKLTQSVMPLWILYPSNLDGENPGEGVFLSVALALGLTWAEMILTRLVKGMGSVFFWILL